MASTRKPVGPSTARGQPPRVPAVSVEEKGSPQGLGGRAVAPTRFLSVSLRGLRSVLTSGVCMWSDTKLTPHRTPSLSTFPQGPERRQ